MKKLKKFPMRCCGNSPGKMHTENCDMGQPGSGTHYNHSGSTACTSAAAKRRKSTAELKNRKQLSRAQIIKSAPRGGVKRTSAIKSRPLSGAGLKKQRRPQMKKVRDENAQSIDNQVLYNIDSNGRAVQVLGSSQDDGSQMNNYNYSE